MYLLDDVLSGLDARVAAHVLQRCVLGALRHTARVLVAHAPAHLARAHRVLLLRDGRLHAQGLSLHLLEYQHYYVDLCVINLHFMQAIY